VSELSAQFPVIFSKISAAACRIRMVAVGPYEQIT
jgi:hypothetical protein